MFRFRVKIIGVIVVIGLIVLYCTIEKLDAYTSKDSFCISCHVHTEADQSWVLSSHYKTDLGEEIHCIDCHLPPKESADYWPAKIKAGSQDLYAYHFKDHDKFNWPEKSEIENAVRFTPKESCINCHDNLFPFDLSKKGEKAHLYYRRNEADLHCINCHKGVGHGDSTTMYEPNTSFLKRQENILPIHTKSAKVERFKNYTETIPGSSVSFDMIAIPSGEFEMSIYPNNRFKHAPLVRKKIYLSSFFMAKVELTWDAYRAFLTDVESEGREQAQVNDSIEADVISGATPPWGDPAQGWGMGQRPAISMTWQAANIYCRWLSEKTGKTYRLPTEAEWEYACRANSDLQDNWTDEEMANRIIFRNNSSGKTHLPEGMKANAFGLVNMLGNVKEFCSDWYAGNPFENKTETLLFNPKGPMVGMERVIKGGSYRSKKENVRVDYRESTQHDKWLRTDPQMPKSIWWYSDCRDVGFRLVCEWDGDIEKQ